MDMRERLELLVVAQNNPDIQQVHIELSKRNPVYWFNNFCWTFDPRKKVPDIPFVLYDYQEWFVQELISCIREGEDLCVEKSRDMGLSWIFMLVFQYLWLFDSGASFHVGSRKESEVDQAQEDPENTLFGKFRYNLYKLPVWMRPEVNDKSLSIQNLSNMNSITGESANTNFGRGQRKKAILFDELSAWDNAEAAWASASQTTPCRIANGTPLGEDNKYAKILNHERNIPVVYPKMKQRLIEKGMMDEHGNWLKYDPNWPTTRVGVL